MASNPFNGARYMLRGVRLITQPALRPFVIVPVLINVAVFSVAIWYAVTRFEGLMERLASTVPAWLQWIDWLLWPLFILALLIIVFFGFSLLANLIASPFNGLLAEKAEALITGQPVQDNQDFKRLLRELPTTLIDELRKLIYAALWTLPFLLLAFIVPVIGPLIWFLFTAWMLAVEYSDFPMGNHGLLFADMRARLRQRRMLSLGFGSAAAGLTMLPILNFIAMPASVVGATVLWVEELQHVPPDSTG
jgi:CysZ protein